MYPQPQIGIISRYRINARSNPRPVLLDPDDDQSSTRVDEAGQVICRFFGAPVGRLVRLTLELEILILGKSDQSSLNGINVDAFKVRREQRPQSRWNPASHDAARYVAERDTAPGRSQGRRMH
jgi:hypothetical protein